MRTKGIGKALLLVAAILGSGVLVESWEAPAPEEKITYLYEMEQGDTVYNVAARVATPRENINRLSWQILKDNHITDPGTVQPGTVLTIRVDPASKALNHDN